MMLAAPSSGSFTSVAAAAPHARRLSFLTAPSRDSMYRPSRAAAISKITWSDAAMTVAAFPRSGAARPVRITEKRGLSRCVSR